MKIKELLTKSYVRHVIIFLSIFIVAQVLIIVGIFFSFQHSVNQQRETISNNMIKTLDETLTRSVDQAETDLQSLMAMYIDTRILSGNHENARVTVANNLANTLNTFITATKATDAYIIYSAANDIFLLSRSGRVAYGELETLREFAETLGESEGQQNPDWHVVFIGGKHYLLHFYYYYDCYFIAAFHVDTFLTTTAYDKLFDDSNCIALTNAGSQVLAATGNSETIGRLEELEGLPKGYYINTQPLTYGSLYASHIYQENLGVGTDVLPVFIVAICLSSLILLVVFLRYLRYEILVPIDELSTTTHIIKHGDYTRRAKLECNTPELLELAESINSMITTIIHQRIASYENAIKQKNLELKYLQMQLRPHHFLNTLSTIASMTYLGDNERIRRFVELYSRDARYLFSVSFREVPLEEEIQHIQDYIACQSILFPDRVFSFIDIQPAAKEWCVPQMMLHALVENIYKHAVSMDRFTSFFVRASVRDRGKEKALEIIVEDDGAGFPQEVIESVNHSDGDMAESSHIGLMNICHTLYLMYGRTRLMELSNKKDHGGMIRIIIPQKKEEPRDGVQRSKGDRNADTGC